APSDPQGMPGGMDKVEMAVAGAAVEMVGPEPCAHKFLEEIQLFVGAAGGDQAGNRIWSVLALNFREPIHHMVHGFEPRSFDELIAFAKKRLLQTCGAIDVFEPEPPPHTEPAVPLGGLGSVAPFV